MRMRTELATGTPAKPQKQAFTDVVFVISLRGFYPFGVLQINYVWWYVAPMYTVLREWLEHQVLIVLTIFFCLFFQIAPQTRRAV